MDNTNLVTDNPYEGKVLEFRPDRATGSRELLIGQGTYGYQRERRKRKTMVSPFPLNGGDAA